MLSFPDYIILDDSAMTCDFVRSFSECEFAARELGLTDLTVIDDEQIGASNDPPFCYIEGKRLKFNNFGTNTGSCGDTSYGFEDTDQCICRQNQLCAKNPCGEGQGDCDDNTECEGTLVCGHLNCMNSTVTDCCAQE